MAYWEKLNLKIFLTGIVLVLVISIGLKILFGTLGGYIGMVAAGIIIGYILNSQMKISAIYGALSGLTGGILWMLLGILIIYMFASQYVFTAVQILYMFLLIIFYAFLTAIGSVAGSIVKKNRS